MVADEEEIRGRLATNGKRCLLAYKDHEKPESPAESGPYQL